MSATRLPMTPPRPISQTSPADQVSYGDLYTRWERGNWRATELDFSQDRVHWREQFSELERRSALWNYALFFHGEDSVADNLSPYIDAAPRDEQRHIAFGVKLVSDLIAEDPECVDAIVELMNEVIPYTTAVLVPPDWDESYIECFGITLEELYEDAAASLEAKLRAAGVPPE